MLGLKKGDFLLLVGTTKGAFIFRSNAQRTRWELAGPDFHGHYVYALEFDGRAGQRRIWAATSNYWGTMLRSSDDFGKSWTNPQQTPVRFPADTGMSLKNIWQITLGPADEPDVLYCGVEPAALFETLRLGRNLVQRGDSSIIRIVPVGWPATAASPCIRSFSIQPNKQRLYVAISAGGVYRTDDGGMTWTAQNRGVRAMFLPDKYPEFGQCVHKIALHPKRPERLFLQNHWGVYRSDIRRKLDRRSQRQSPLRLRLSGRDASTQSRLRLHRPGGIGMNSAALAMDVSAYTAHAAREVRGSR